MLIISHQDVADIVRGKEIDIIDVVRAAYWSHDAGRTAVPHSVFLRFPEDAHNRMIGLAAYLGTDEPTVGMKWIASFPGNIAKGLPRASAVIVLNSMDDGRPEALIEGSQISAKRTAASAALAASILADQPDGLAIIGCGEINLEVVAFTVAALPDVTTVMLYDTEPARSEAFATRAAKRTPRLEIRIAATIEEALGAHRLISVATTAATPHLDVTPCQQGAMLLHLSLRDLPAETILASQNVVDDADHVCQERTSLHLTEQLVGHRNFIGTSIGRLIREPGCFARDQMRRLVFSPFGLGALDIALAQYVCIAATRERRGITAWDFLPH